MASFLQAVLPFLGSKLKYLQSFPHMNEKKTIFATLNKRIKF